MITRRMRLNFPAKGKSGFPVSPKSAKARKAQGVGQMGHIQIILLINPIHLIRVTVPLWSIIAIIKKIKTDLHYYNEAC